MFTAIAALRKICQVEKDMAAFGEGAMLLTFTDHDATTTLRIVMRDQQSGADIIITNIKTKPASARRKGAGSTALKQLLKWANGHRYPDIQAVGVREPSEAFWARHGFVALGNVYNDFVYRPPSAGDTPISQKPPA